MTTSVADKTPISAQVWRRHQDPPGLWMAVAIGSLSLHLLAFWWVRSSNTLRFWFPQQSQAIVPIELIEISPQSSTTKPQSPPATKQAAAPSTSTNQEEQGLNIGGSVQQDNSSNTSPPNTQAFTEETSPQPDTTFTPTPEPTQPTPQSQPETTQPTPSPTAIVPSNELPWNRRQDIELGQGTPLPSNIPSVTPEQLAESEAVEENTPRTLDEETASDSSDDNSDVSGETASNSPVDNPSSSNGENASNSSDHNSSNPDTPNTPSGSNSPTPTVGGSIATVFPIADTEVRQLIQEGKIGDNDLPDVFAVYQGSQTKTLDPSYLPNNSKLQPAKLLASLVIDQNGNFQQAVVLGIEPASLQSEKSLYEQLINEVMRNESCLPSQSRDGKPIDLSNCYIWITIESVKAN